LRGPHQYGGEQNRVRELRATALFELTTEDTFGLVTLMTYGGRIGHAFATSWHRDRMTRGMVAVILFVVIVGATFWLTFELVQEAVRSRPPAR
jgi:cellobiose-specific phosphotransferase system component IIC